MRKARYGSGQINLGDNSVELQKTPVSVLYRDHFDKILQLACSWKGPERLVRLNLVQSKCEVAVTSVDKVQEDLFSTSYQ